MPTGAVGNPLRETWYKFALILAEALSEHYILISVVLMLKLIYLVKVNGIN